MTGRRSKTEIYTDVLTTIKNGECRPTRIMYSTNLSWKPLTQILSALEKQGLIKTTASDDEKSRVLYEITEKGENVLAYFKEFNNIIKDEPLSILG